MTTLAPSPMPQPQLVEGECVLAAGTLLEIKFWRCQYSLTRAYESNMNPAQCHPCADLCRLLHLGPEPLGPLNVRSVIYLIRANVANAQLVANQIQQSNM